MATAPDARRSAVARAMPASTRGTPIWLAVAPQDPGALALAEAVEAGLVEAGWRKAGRVPVGFPLKPGVFLFAAESPAPEAVTALEAMLRGLGLNPSVGSGYRAFAAEMRQARPGWRGFDLPPGQDYVLVIGRQP